jgi:ankyrin repeat protein
VKEIQGMVEAMANPPPPPTKTYNRHLAPELIEAVKEGDIPNMERLLKMGASPNHKVPTAGEDSLRWSAVRWAAMKGSEAKTAEQMEEHPLLENGVEVLKLLLEHGGDVDQTDEAGQTALHTACFLGKSRRDIIETLLEAGAETDIVGKDGFSPLHWAAKENHEGIPTLLEEYGAEMNLGDNYDMTALFIASDRQLTDVVKELLTLGADPNYGIESDVIKPMLHLVKGITPLMVAVMPIDAKEVHTTLATVNALLDGGADPYQPDGEGMTVFDRSRCREGAGWLETNEGRSEFHKVCKRLDQAKDDVKEKKIMETEVAQLFYEHLDKTEDGVQRSWNSYQRLFYDKGFSDLADLKNIRNEMDLLDLGVRKRTQAFKLMKIIRETDPDYWDKLEAEGDVPEVDITKFPRMERGGRGDETTTGKVKAKKGSKMYKAASKGKGPQGPPKGKDDL